jgi:hypothetical protein
MKRILFVHIPKTAGTSVWQWLKNNNLENWKRISNLHHESISELKKLNDTTDTFSFAVVRNPYTRIISYWHHAVTQRLLNNLDNCYPTLLDFLNAIANRKPSPTTPYMIYDQSHYVCENNKIAISKVYKFENLKELQNDLNITKLSNARKQIYNTHLFTDEEISLIQKLYAKDFKLFNYSNIPSYR